MNKKRIRKKNDKLSGQEYLLTSAKALSALIDGKLPFTVWNKKYTKRIWIKLRFPEGYVYEDVRIMYLLLAEAERIVTVDQELVLQRIRSGSITRTKTAKNIMDLFLAKRILEEYVIQHTPQIFTEGQKKRFQEKNLRNMINIYSSWLIHPTTENKKAREELKKDIFHKREELDKHFNSRQTAVVWLMFNHCPRLIFPSQKLFNIIMHIFVKK